MSIPYERTGRTAQKSRTRQALIDAARELLTEGVSPTVEQAAAAAQISRATAYRYFPNQRSLLVATSPVIEADSLLGPEAPEAPDARLDAVVRELAAQTLENEAALRAMLRLSLQPNPPEPEQLPLRRGRAIVWIEDALAPAREQLGEQATRKLAMAIRCAVGIEALVWLTDIGGLTREEAAELMRWSALALLRSTLAERGLQ